VSRCAEPDDYPETDTKSHFVKFDIAQRHKGSEQPNWITINCYGKVADKAIDGLGLVKGDKVRVNGFLVGKFARARCGSSHRFTVVTANDILYVMGSREREHLHYDDVEWPEWFGGLKL
jgi:single-stranded DNA-binding protein